MTTRRSHPHCHTESGHDCQQPSGATCIEDGCEAAAGTDWGPYWCPEHDEARLDRLSEQFAALATGTTQED
jgi:hypothetical protein